MGWKAAWRVRTSGLKDSTQVDALEALAVFMNEGTGATFPSLSLIVAVSRKTKNAVRQTITELMD